MVVPSNGRAGLIEKMLLSVSIAREKIDFPVEVLVIDDSLQEDMEKIRAACARFGAIYIQGVESVRVKRNMGIKKALYDIILFIDSDCEADPGSVEGTC